MSADRIDWHKVRRVVIVRLRSIGDTVLSTPSLLALKRFAPHVKVDILLEDWVAPVLNGFQHVDNVISVGIGLAERTRTAWLLSHKGYDVAFNLHGGATSAFFTAASLAKHKFGIKSYQYSFLHNHLLSSPSDFWRREHTHSAEQQLAVLGYAGVPVEDRPRTSLTVTPSAAERARAIIGELANEKFALIHAESAFHTKRWPAGNYARTIEFLASLGLSAIAVAGPVEIDALNELRRQTRVPIAIHNDLSLPEITAVAAHASLFVGNDSGIAHIASAVNTPSVVIFGSSNRTHWGPWTDAPHEMIFTEFACQPCAGYICAEFGEPQYILSVKRESVFEAISRIMEKSSR